MPAVRLPRRLPSTPPGSCLKPANDLGDHAAIAACRRVIDAELNGTVAGSADIDLVLGYFR
ncbi:hypothetical protein ACVWZR_006208 [Bradyrhizobium sp. i1.3.1]